MIGVTGERDAAKPTARGRPGDAQGVLSPHGLLAGLLDWLAAAAARRPEPRLLFGELCERLCGLGLPLWRSAVQLEGLHPLYYGYCLHWTRGQEAFELMRSHEFAASDEFRLSPYMASLRAGGSYRDRLETDPTPELPLLARLKAEGYTDFLAEIIRTPDPMPPGITWATRRPGGFAAAEVEALRALAPHFGPAFGWGAERQKTDAVLRTYLGTGPAREVTSGHVRRGDLRRIEAVVLLTDLRGFSDKLVAWPEGEVIEALGGYFEAVAEAVAAHGGDVLKLMGDGVLAVFPLQGSATREQLCAGALAAVSRAREAVAALNERRALAGRPPLEFVAVLHLGPLAYGNVGARERLDFTVLGPAVNVASRLEALAKGLGERTLLTAEVAAHAPGPTRGLGSFALRGLPGEWAVHAVD